MAYQLSLEDLLSMIQCNDLPFFYIYHTFFLGVRDYIHVVDLAKGHLKAIDKTQEDCGLKVGNTGINLKEER